MTSTVPIVVPEGKTCGDLTLGELDAASSHLGCDISGAFNGEIPGKRYAATIEFLYRWAKRSDPKAKREDFRDYDIDDASRALRLDDAGAAGPDGEPDPTSVGSSSDLSESP